MSQRKYNSLRIRLDRNEVEGIIAALEEVRKQPNAEQVHRHGQERARVRLSVAHQDKWATPAGGKIGELDHWKLPI